MNTGKSEQLCAVRRRYWKSNVIVIAVLLAIWFVASCGCGILFIEPLNRLSIGNLPLGFWMANQGSMLIFVALILIYAVVMDVVDRRYFAAVAEIEGGDRDN